MNYELRLSKQITQNQLIKGISSWFAIPVDKILITDEITGDEDISGIFILCIYNQIKGEFPTYLIIIDYQTQPGFGPEKELAVKAAKWFDCRVLICTALDTADPYVWDVVDQDGKLITVSVVADKLDNDGEFYLDKGL